MFTASAELCMRTCRGLQKLLASSSPSAESENAFVLSFICLSLLTVRQPQCTAGSMWRDFWESMTALLKPWLQCRRMFLGLPAKPEQLSSVKAWTGNLSLKLLFSVHVLWQKDGSGTHSWLVLHPFEEQTVLISITHTRSTKRRSATAEELCHRCARSDWEIRLRFTLHNSSVPRANAKSPEVDWSCYTSCNVLHIHSHKHLCASAYFTLLPDSQATSLHISSHMSHTESLWQPD